MRTRAKAYQLNNWCLPDDLFARIFSLLPEDERWTRIPLVCQEWRRAHNAFPPEHPNLCIRKPISDKMLEWIARVTPSLQILVIKDEAGPVASILQLLKTAAAKAPRLHTLDVKTWHPGHAILPALAAFSQIKRLDCSNIDFRPDDCAGHAGYQSLTGLLSLEELTFDKYSWWLVNRRLRASADNSWAESQWNSLAALGGLTSIKFHLEYCSYILLNDISSLLFISKLTQVKSVAMHNVNALLFGERLCQALGTMTQLTFLELWEMTASTVAPIMSLPRLEKLELGLASWDPQPAQPEDGHNQPDGAGLLLECERLTELCISGGRWRSASDLLLPTAPALQRLKRLRLTYGGLYIFPDSLANALGQLQLLDLNGNDLESIPPAVSRITTLKDLLLGSNDSLQLDLDDIIVLQALPDLQCLELSRLLEDGTDDSGFSQNSVGVLIELANHLPGVYLAGFDEV